MCVRLRVEAGQRRVLTCTLKMESGLSLGHFQTDTLHIPGGRDHYIKGWVQRTTNRMMFYGTRVNNSSNIGFHLTSARIKDIICLSRLLYTRIILTLSFLMLRSYFWVKREVCQYWRALFRTIVLFRRYGKHPNESKLATYRSCLSS